MITREFEEKIDGKTTKKLRIIRVARGIEPADLVLKNAVYVNVFSNELCKGDIAVAEGLVVGMGNYEGTEEYDASGKIVCPGFVDAHIHLESAVVTPDRFAAAVLPHGTTTVITDPHEIANVMGDDGIEYMLQATAGLPIDVHFMLPSCVPSTPEDESGAVLGYRDIDRFYGHPKVLGLAEMMDYVGVINGDRSVVEKIIASQAHHKKIDGHAPGLSGNELNAYISAGVYSDHECYDLDNALEKLRKGQFIMIRDGTAAHNLDALLPLLTPQYCSRCMFATDDKHPSDLLENGHIDYLVRRAVKAGVDPIIAVKTASHHAARYFLLNNKGAVAPGYLADLTVVDNLYDLNTERVYKKGRLVYDGEVKPFEKPQIWESLIARAHSSFFVKTLSESDFSSDSPLGVVGMINGEIVTESLGTANKTDIEADILKAAVIERHRGTGHIGLGFLKGYGLKKGAVATSISHDSHNIIAVGASENDMATAVNRVVRNAGGIVVAEGGRIIAELELPVAGLMSELPLEAVNTKLEAAKAAAYSLGVNRGIDPFMTLSFMSLTVIPKARITTFGVIDTETGEYVSGIGR